MKLSYLICYDIRSPKRLQKIHKIVITYAVPLQFSVFYGLMSKQLLNEMIKKFNKVINQCEDDIRIYPIQGTSLEHWPKQGFNGNDAFLLLS